MPEYTTEQLKEFESYLIHTREYWLIKKRSAAVVTLAVLAVLAAFGFTQWAAAGTAVQQQIREYGVANAISNIVTVSEQLEDGSAPAQRLLELSVCVDELSGRVAELSRTQERSLSYDWKLVQLFGHSYNYTELEQVQELYASIKLDFDDLPKERRDELDLMLINADQSIAPSSVGMRGSECRCQQ